MTRKDYVLLAEVLADARAESGADTATVDATARKLADRLHADNPRFDVARFMLAAGVSE